MTDQGGEQTQQAGMIELPEKTYFKIGEVAKLLEVEPYVLRYWESEFDVLDPEKTKSGQRVYQRPDIELLVQIQTLLYEEMFSIAGARRQIARKREGKSSYFDLEQGRQPSAQGTAVAGDEQLREQLEQTRRQLTAAETRANEKDEQLERAEEQVDQLQQQLEEVNQQLSQTKRELKSLHREATKLRRTNGELQQQLEQLERHEESGPSEQELRTDELRAEVEELRSKLSEARQQASDRQNGLRRKLNDRRDKRRRLLGSLRREVEAIAALTDGGGPSVR